MTTRQLPILPLLCGLGLWLLYFGLFPDSIGPHSWNVPLQTADHVHRNVTTRPRRQLASLLRNTTEPNQHPLHLVIYDKPNLVVVVGSNDAATRHGAKDHNNHHRYQSAVTLEENIAATGGTGNDSARSLGIAALSLACGFVFVVLGVSLLIFRDKLPAHGCKCESDDGSFGNNDEQALSRTVPIVAETPTQGRPTILWHDPVAGKSQNLFVETDIEQPPEMVPPAAILGRRSSSGLRRVRFQLPAATSTATTSSLESVLAETVRSDDDTNDEPVQPVVITVEQTDHVATSSNGCCSAGPSDLTPLKRTIVATPSDPARNKCNPDSWVDRIMHPLCWDPSVCCPEQHDTSNSTFTSLSTSSHRFSQSFDTNTSETPILLHAYYPKKISSSNMSTASSHPSVESVISDTPMLLLPTLEPRNTSSSTHDTASTRIETEQRDDAVDDRGHEEEEEEEEDATRDDSMSGIAAVLGIQRWNSSGSDDDVTVLEVEEELPIVHPPKPNKAAWRTRQWWNGVGTAERNHSLYHTSTKSNYTSVFEEEFDLESLGGNSELWGVGGSTMAEI